MKKQHEGLKGEPTATRYFMACIPWFFAVVLTFQSVWRGTARTIQRDAQQMCGVANRATTLTSSELDLSLQMITLLMRAQAILRK